MGANGNSGLGVRRLAKSKEPRECHTATATATAAAQTSPGRFKFRSTCYAWHPLRFTPDQQRSTGRRDVLSRITVVTSAEYACRD